MIKLSIVALSYNTKDLTLACLKSVVSQYKQKLEKKEFEVIVVDNNSSDNSVAEISNLKSQVSNLIIIQNKENLGFGKGCNLGAKSAKGKYVLFLNSDTQVFDKGFLSMIDFLDKNSNVAVLGGKLENNDGSIQRSCGKFYNLFMYMEDMEICFRANKLGFVTYFYPNVKLKHKSLGSSNRTFAIINIYKGILYFYSRHKTHLEYLVVKLFLITKAGILILVGLLTFNSELRDRYQKAISENL